MPKLIRTFTALEPIRSGQLAYFDYREMRESSDLPEIDQMIQDLRPHLHHDEGIRACREFREYRDQLLREVGRMFRIPKELLCPS